MLNRIILIGRLTRDPEGKYTPSGVPVTSFSIAVDRPQSAEARQQGLEKQTDFIDIVTWRQLAETAANYLQKGRLVAIEGRLQIRDYVTQDGQKRKAAEVVADNFRMLERKQDAEGGGYDNSGGGGYEAPRSAPQPRGDYGGGQAQQRPAPAANRPPARNNPPAASSNVSDDYDDLTDPFAE